MTQTQGGITKMALNANQKAPHLSIVWDSWLPKTLADIRGLYESGDDWMIYVPHLTKEGSLCRFQKNSISTELIHLWQQQRDRLCRSLASASKINRDETVWISSQPMPNYECCIQPVTALSHAKHNGAGHLGDCWLVRFQNGRTTYIPTEYLYKKNQADFGQLSLLI
jgi:hypothetical protein